MEVIEIARRMAGLGAPEEALRAYALVLHGDGEPEERLEAAAYTLQNGGDYKTAYTAFVELYRAGHFRAETLGILTQAFYEPNAGELKGRYERNRKLLKRYPYLFRKDFPTFKALPLRFYPYDDSCYVPFDTRTGELRALVNVKDPVVSRNFFKDLEKPILASGVCSQYELEYLNDNVRPSEWCARENHIYLHYESWEEFCSWLQVLDLRPLAESKKAVFLIGDEISEYPIDFKARFGLDYGGYKPRPIGVREVSRLIWHTQLSSHNGGDFFNEIFDGHPDLLVLPSLLFSDMELLIAKQRAVLEELRARADPPVFADDAAGRTLEKLCRLDGVTDKDLLVATFMGAKNYRNEGDPTARVAPALFFQPHFPSIRYEIEPDGRGNAVLDCAQAEEIRQCEWLRGFKYIKTFTPIRRPTTSHGGTMQFMVRSVEEQTSLAAKGEGQPAVVTDAMTQRVLNRSYLRDPDDRLYHDAVIVRFEDGKLDPEATFTRLAAFLDLPYTESMTYCSEGGEPVSREWGTEEQGFFLWPVYITYDEYMNDDERRYIEFFLRDAYEYYGYGFQAYDGAPVDLERVKEWVAGFGTVNGYMDRSIRAAYDAAFGKNRAGGLDAERPKAGATADEMVKDALREADENRLRVAEIMLGEPRFINRRGQPLQMTPLLEPDPALLKAPLYR